MAGRGRANESSSPASGLCVGHREPERAHCSGARPPRAASAAGSSARMAPRRARPRAGEIEPDPRLAQRARPASARARSRPDRASPRRARSRPGEVHARHREPRVASAARQRASISVALVSSTTVAAPLRARVRDQRRRDPLRSVGSPPVSTISLGARRAAPPSMRARTADGATNARVLRRAAARAVRAVLAARHVGEDPLAAHGCPAYLARAPRCTATLCPAVSAALVSASNRAFAWSERTPRWRSRWARRRRRSRRGSGARGTFDKAALPATKAMTPAARRFGAGRDPPPPANRVRALGAALRTS